MKFKNIDLICLSHLRWNFVFQRPQHLMSRFARNGRVFFFEEPIFEDTEPYLKSSICSETGVRVQTPVVPRGLEHARGLRYQREFLRAFLKENAVQDYAAWFYTPMALGFCNELNPRVTIYDCMDELSAFAGAPSAMREREAELFAKADLVFTGGASLYEAKRKQHQSVHLFPSSVDVPFFAKARSRRNDPADQLNIPYPRLGYAGVIDERMDLSLLKEAARLRPEWHFILLGPVVKIDPASLPEAANIHYLGMKPYGDLPNYFGGWNIGMLPFAMNESTRFISPTKTPEYLAAGLQVISTPIRDVVTPYSQQRLVTIVADADQFVAQGESLLRDKSDTDFLKRADKFLSKSSWDKTWRNMNQLIRGVLTEKQSDVTPMRAIPAVSEAHV